MQGVVEKAALEKQAQHLESLLSVSLCGLLYVSLCGQCKDGCMCTVYGCAWLLGVPLKEDTCVSYEEEDTCGS